MAYSTPTAIKVMKQMLRQEANEAFCLDPANHPTCTGPVRSVNPNKNGTCEKCGRRIPYAVSET